MEALEKETEMLQELKSERRRLRRDSEIGRQREGHVILQDHFSVALFGSKHPPFRERKRCFPADRTSRRVLGWLKGLRGFGVLNYKEFVRSFVSQVSLISEQKMKEEKKISSRSSPRIQRKTAENRDFCRNFNNNKR